MSNATFHKVCCEWSLTRSEYAGEFEDFIESKFPGIWARMNTRDSIGYWREPSAREMQIILKAWQGTHEPIEYRVTRVSKPSAYEIR